MKILALFDTKYFEISVIWNVLNKIYDNLHVYKKNIRTNKIQKRDYIELKLKKKISCLLQFIIMTDWTLLVCPINSKHYEFIEKIKSVLALVLELIPLSQTPYHFSLSINGRLKLVQCEFEDNDIQIRVLCVGFFKNICFI